MKTITAAYTKNLTVPDGVESHEVVARDAAGIAPVSWGFKAWHGCGLVTC